MLLQTLLSLPPLFFLALLWLQQCDEPLLQHQPVVGVAPPLLPAFALLIELVAQLSAPLPLFVAVLLLPVAICAVLLLPLQLLLAAVPSQHVLPPSQQQQLQSVPVQLDVVLLEVLLLLLGIKGDLQGR